MEKDIRRTLDHPLLTQVLFYPTPLTEADVPDIPGGEIVSIPVKDDKLGAYWYHPLEKAPAVIFFHGNGEVMTDYLYDFHKSVEALGANLLVVDYRGYGLSTGRPNLPRLLEDCRAAWKFLVESIGVPPDRIIIMGRSLGSLAAAELASDLGGGARALVIESGIARFDLWIDKMASILERFDVEVDVLKRDLQEAFDQESKLKAFGGPILIMHAPFDDIVPVENGKLLASYGDPAKTRLHIFPVGGHNDVQAFNKKDYFEVMREFISGL